MSRAVVLRASRRDWVLTAVIAVVCVVAVVGAYFSGSLRAADLHPADQPVPEAPATLAEIPAQVAPAFTLANGAAPQTSAGVQPIATNGLIIAADGDTVRAVDAEGQDVWSYTRTDAPLCSLATAWDKVVATYRTSVGCGDTVAIDATTGQYSDTRSALNSEETVPVSSNDRVGTASTDRVELWRSDMVRTVEYGEIPAPQEAHTQPHPECTINSALTRTELLVVSETCPDAANRDFLRFQTTEPEDSRTPDVNATAEVEAASARLVAVGQSAATVYAEGDTPELISFSDDGTVTHRQAVPSSPAVSNSPTLFQPATADLPHHMTWFDGARLYLFSPNELKVTRVVDGALGTGAAIGDRLLVPTADGIAVYDWKTGQTERTVPVDRGSYRGPVHLTVAGTNLVEARGGQLVALQAAPA